MEEGRQDSSTWVWGLGEATADQLGIFFLLLFWVVRSRFLGRSRVFCWSKFFPPKGHLKSVSEGRDHESDRPIESSRSCFCKPKFKSLAKAETALWSEAKDSNKSYQLTNQAPFSFSLWLPINTPPFLSERHSSQLEYERAWCVPNHTGSPFSGFRGRKESSWQLGVPVCDTYSGSEETLDLRLEHALHLVKRQRHRIPDTGQGTERWKGSLSGPNSTTDSFKPWPKCWDLISFLSHPMLWNVSPDLPQRNSRLVW